MFAASKTASVTGGYQISRSLRFNSADSAYLNRTLTTPTNANKFTLSLWVKRGKLTAPYTLFNVSNTDYIQFGPTDKISVVIGNSICIDTTAVFRDPSAWYHLVFSYDSSASPKWNAYVNNVNNGTGTLGSATFNTAVAHYIGNVITGGNYFDGYITETNFIDGQTLTPSSFGATDAQTGVWQPKGYAGTYGTNGFYLNFSDNSNTTAATLGKDYSGNGNNFTPNNFSVTAGAGNDSLVDSPTSYGGDTGVGGDVRGNYATLNPLDYSSAATTTFSNGNLDTSIPYNFGYTNAQSTFSVSSGKWYCEITPTNIVGAMIGICDASVNTYDKKNFTSASWWGYFLNGNKYNNNTASAYGASFTTNDVIGIALDMDTGAVTFYKNGTSQGVAFNTNISGKTIQISLNNGSGSATQTYTVNFGQRPFAYTAPSGFKALCTQNLPTPTIGATTATQAGKYFNTILWSGTSSGTTRSLTGVGFQPDWIWTKSRNGGYQYELYDAVRGAGNTKSLSSNSTNSEALGNVDLYGYVSSFDSDGFTGTNGTDATIPYAYFNQSGQNYVAWNWKANGSGSTNTSGSITSTVSANTTSGFSVVTYTGSGANATVGHGLGIAPSMVIVKSRSATGGWAVYHRSLGATKFMELNSTGAVGTSTIPWNDTEPTSTVFTIGTWTGTNASGVTLVAYCFAPVAGYSAFGSYTGNGSTDGPFVYTGFRPAYVLIKQSSDINSWFVWDSSRSSNNVASATLKPNSADAEETSYSIDILSNGFKIRTTDSRQNTNGGTYIYACFASNPFKYSLAR